MSDAPQETNNPLPLEVIDSMQSQLQLRAIKSPTGEVFINVDDLIDFMTIMSVGLDDKNFARVAMHLKGMK